MWSESASHLLFTSRTASLDHQWLSGGGGGKPLWNVQWLGKGRPVWSTTTDTLRIPDRYLLGDVGLWRGGSSVDHRATCDRPRWVSQSAEMVVFSIIKYIHIFGWTACCAFMAGLCLFVLSKGARASAQWSETEGAEGLPPGQAGLRGYVYDRSEGLGRRTYLGSNHYRKNLGEY